MVLDELIHQLKSLSSLGKGFKPHKYLALLTLVHLIRDGHIEDGKIFYNDLFKEYFKKNFDVFADSDDRNRPYNPFFHLRSSGFWILVATDGNKDALDGLNSIGGPGELTRLVSHAQIDSELVEELQNESARERLESAVAEILQQRKYRKLGSNGSNRVISESTSLYAHEDYAIRRIDDAVKVNNLGYICSNLDIHDPQSNRYFEIDILIISQFGIYVVELKHWTGNIHVKPNMWLVNGFSRPDPHKGNNHKAKLIRGLCTRKFPYFKWPYVESIVTLTHPDAVVMGSSLPNTSDNNPTFDSINHLIDYLKRQRRDKEATLSSLECKNIASFIMSLHTPGRPRDTQFPGYEIVTRMYQSAEREEVIARRTDIRHRRLTRLRIFFAAQPDSDMERDPFVEQAMATLNAVAGVGEHPNILRVWSIPNEYGYIVEGSDWSEQGTLRNAIDTQAPFDMEKALTITRGILHGLQAIHEIGVIHRSLSPENILLVEDIPKLMNFDLSYQIADDRMTVIPDPSKLKRQPYIAPEIYQNADSLSESADIFSVGVLLYEMLTGEGPFKCSTDLAQTNGRLSERCLDKLRENNIPDSAISLINGLVQLTDTARPATVSDILQRLDKHVTQPVPAATNPQLKPGDSYNLYEIVEFLGKGAESQTYRARGPMGEPFVLKFFNIDVPLERIFQEQKLSAAVSHPAIAKAENYCRWSDQRLVLAFKAIDGYTLREQAKKELPELNYFNQIAQTLIDAINALHSYKEDGDENPILHNDIKPENIVVTCDGRPVLLDFGIARVLCSGRFVRPWRHTV
jgi:serine/threonine protein kinase